MSITAIASMVGLVAPPVFDFIKKKWLGSESDTPEATMSTLATTKPEIMPDFANAHASLLKSKVEWFNRDVVGTPSQWCIDLRAAIRPITTVLSMGILALEGNGVLTLDPGTRASLTLVVSSWFGSRLCK